jgi:hypothetical protein
LFVDPGTVAPVQIVASFQLPLVVAPVSWECTAAQATHIAETKRNGLIQLLIDPHLASSKTNSENCFRNGDETRLSRSDMTARSARIDLRL